MIIEIYLTLAITSILMFIVLAIYAREIDNGVALLPIASVFLLATALSSGSVEFVQFGTNSTITVTEHFPSLMILFTGLFLLSIAMAVIYSLFIFKE